MSAACFHCGDQVPRGLNLYVEVAGEPRAVCCIGCEAVANFILSGGGEDYYQHRAESGLRLDAREVLEQERWTAFDQVAIPNDSGICELAIIAEGIKCAACTWLIEHQVSRLTGVIDVQADISSGQVMLRWHDGETELSEVLAVIVSLGYRPHPVTAQTASKFYQHQRSDMLKRLTLAGLGMMQTGMYTFGSYIDASAMMDPSIARLLLLVSMLITTPVVFYSGAPFLRAAWRSLETRRPDMDLPVAIALLSVYGISVWNTLIGSGPTYFESAAMFVFFLLTARFVAQGMQHQSTSRQLAMLSLIPSTVARMDRDKVTHIPISDLRPGDHIRVREGERLPADGVIIEGCTRVNESMLTGESELIQKEPGSHMLAGSVNGDSTIVVLVSRCAADTRLAKMAAMFGLASRSRETQDRFRQALAVYFAPLVLLLALAAFGGWYWLHSERAFEVAIAVLVVTCPCALSLAIPASQAAAAAAAAKKGLLVCDLSALERLSRVSIAVFDKTGTLSLGRPEISRTEVNEAHPRPMTCAELLATVAAVEQNSSHPIARAFQHIEPAASVSNIEVIPGAGIVAAVGGREIRIGSAAFANPDSPYQEGIFVADEAGLLSRIRLQDQWREDAAAVISRLKRGSIRTNILSGDSQQAASRAQQELGLDQAQGRVAPEAKCQQVQDYQASGHVVMAVGDGVNDVALMRAADVSIALGQGAAITHSNADIVLASDRLMPIVALLKLSKSLTRTIRQNMVWAISYNLLAVPLAMAGVVGPGLAALGMSLSSIVVVLNATRLTRSSAPERANSTHVAGDLTPRFLV